MPEVESQVIYYLSSQLVTLQKCESTCHHNKTKCWISVWLMDLSYDKPAQLPEEMLQMHISANCAYKCFSPMSNSGHCLGRRVV